ncbi:glycoside hydrolase family 2 TIM barrel-domain containing protein [Paenibacillus sp. Leaf72]|uniref:glycoside hydrolase family 2 TIM barrel-domain containing protein n=1 Tax=Paenibacillus sp. Leaf72 TaxID=1736234 RepID=UPI0006FB4E75|nr:glycoside hydrolase family 2 TIM barrel-domain containing protein [Paenibacillus sp. Leaf72]KQN99903.1 glycoside hydrolase family 2 [Paenibacillus sp. Leaf72]
MYRAETLLMNGWEFTKNEPADDNFEPVHLPHDWAITAPIDRHMKQGEPQGFRDRWGIGWYRKTLVLEEKKEGHVYQLQFDGVYENSTVWVNGISVGGRKYGYSRFTLDITDAVHAGDNLIQVKVDNTSMPADRWYSGAGIYRTVKLLTLQEKHLNPEHIQVVSKVEGDNAVVKIHTGVAGFVSANMTNGRLSYTGESDNGSITIDIPSPKLWSPEQPHLYNVELTLHEDKQISDIYKLRIGIRTIEMVAGKGMYLNGQVTKIKGFCVHQDAGSLGIAVTPEIWRERFLKFKEMGCNAVRVSHHIPASELLDLCDELGLLVYEEPFDKWTGGSYRRYFETEWQRDLECMVRRDRNHPCIFMWGVGNEVENQGQASMLSILRMLKDHLLTLDDTRPVSYAMNPHFKYEDNVDLSKVEDIQQFVDTESDTEIYDQDERIERIRRIAEIVDVISCNYQEQWYPGIHKVAPDKLILGTETYQFFRGHPEQMQNFSDEVPWMDVEKHDYVIGGMLWTGIDYLGESMGYPAKGWAGSLFWTNNERKPLSYLYESYWSEKPMVYFALQDYSLQDEGVKQHWDAPRYASHWNFQQFNKTVIPYMIASNCEEVVLELNGKQYHVKQPSSYPSRMITGYLPYLPGTVKVRGFNGGQEACSYTLQTAGPTVRLSFDEETVKLPAKDGYHRLLTVRAIDQEGTPVFRESAKVTFQVIGPAEIVRVDNGDLCSSEPYDRNWMHMYRGCVSTIIRLSGEKGRIVLTAYADGLYSAEVVVLVI